jgi:hypothetical protein
VIPEEDQGPAWLRNFSYTDFGDIDANLTAMEDFAQKLSGEVEDNYAPHVTAVTDAMLTELPPPAATFPELVSFMQAHNEAQNTTQQNVWNFAQGTNNFATAATQISKDYRGSDAFSHARVRDVNNAFYAVSQPDGGDSSTQTVSDGGS